CKRGRARWRCFWRRSRIRGRPCPPGRSRRRFWKARPACRPDPAGNAAPQRLLPAKGESTMRILTCFTALLALAAAVAAQGPLLAADEGVAAPTNIGGVS